MQLRAAGGVRPPLIVKRAPEGRQRDGADQDLNIDCELQELGPRGDDFDADSCYGKRNCHREELKSEFCWCWDTERPAVWLDEQASGQDI